MLKIKLSVVGFSRVHRFVIPEQGSLDYPFYFIKTIFSRVSMNFNLSVEL